MVVPERLNCRSEVEAHVLALRRVVGEASALDEYGILTVHRTWPVAM